MGDDCPVFDGLFEYCSISAGGSMGIELQLLISYSRLLINSMQRARLVFQEINVTSPLIGPGVCIMQRKLKRAGFAILMARLLLIDSCVSHHELM